MSYVFADLTLRQFTEASQRAAVRACIIRQRESLFTEPCFNLRGFGGSRRKLYRIRPACDEGGLTVVYFQLIKIHVHEFGQVVILVVDAQGGVVDFDGDDLSGVAESDCARDRCERAVRLGGVGR